MACVSVDLTRVIQQKRKEKNAKKKKGMNQVIFATNNMHFFLLPLNIDDEDPRP
jgi:hypothetical protein